MERVFVALQFATPKRHLSRAVGFLSRLRGGWLTHAAIAVFCRVFGVDMAEAAPPPATGYPSFNAFFTRALREGCRPLPASATAVACPADGRISECGRLAGDRALQAKGIDYRLGDLFDDDAGLAARFSDGTFCTVYLAPYNYHRVHLPLDGHATALRYVPGSLFSVNAATTRRLTGLFCRNERVVVVYACAGGWFALVMVGAMNVGSIELTLPSAAPFINRAGVPRWAAGITHALDEPASARGAEFGRFNMGSTVILLASPGVLALAPSLAAGHTVRVGQALGEPSRLA